MDCDAARAHMSDTQFSSLPPYHSVSHTISPIKFKSPSETFANYFEESKNTLITLIESGTYPHILDLEGAIDLCLVYIFIY